MKYKIKNQTGFTVGTGIFIIILIIGVYFTGKLISSWNRENKKQGDLIQAKFDGEEAEYEQNYEEPTNSQSVVKDSPIEEVEVRVDVLTVTLTATLPKPIKGECYAYVEQATGPTNYRFFEELEYDDTCTISIPRAKLKDSKNWTYKITYADARRTIRGNSGTKTINL